MGRDKLRIADDPAIAQIEALSRDGETLSYAWLKRTFGRVQISEDVWRSLNRGRAILSSVDQLDQYLFSYAPMIASQWERASEVLAVRSYVSGTRLIDYGCGQGLAGLLLHDHLGPSLLKDVRAIVLVEPSALALRRATAIYQALAPAAIIIPVNKTFSALRGADLDISEAQSSVHVFSNVLDVDGYDHVALLRGALSPGRHTIIAIGHDRTSHGYSQGMLTVKAAVETGSIHPAIKVLASGLEQFTCGHKGEAAMLWLCKLDIADE